MITKLYYLEFLSPLHASSGGFGLGSTEEIIRSDTLFSAICSEAAALFDEKTMDEIFFNIAEPKIFLSSAFPYFDGQLFFPKPLSWRPTNFNQLTSDDRKQLNKVDYVSLALFKKMLAGEPLDFPIRQEDEENLQYWVIASKCWCEKRFPEENFKLFKILEMPRVTIDRTSQEATLFHLAQIEFRKNAGLFFLGKFRHENACKHFETALYALAETGIGGDRSVGKGQFQILGKPEEFEFPELTNAKGFVTLSLFLPEKNELSALDLKKSSYGFTLRQGWIHHTTLRRRTFRMFTEGSVFEVIKGQAAANGKLALALHQSEFPAFITHNVYRSGLAFTLPMRLVNAES